MVFSSTVFLFIFFPVTYLLYRMIYNLTVRNIILTVTSLVFYAYGEPFAVILMLVSIVMNYGCGLMMNRRKWKKPVLILSIIVNVLLLVVFKYLGFLVSLFNQMSGLTLPVPEIALPIGISFFTFQAMSYVIDAYKDEKLIEKNILHICLYISFFPQLIAGPIIKFSDVAVQIKQRTHTTEKTVYGIQRFICGLSKKLIIANSMATLTDNVFSLNTQEMNLPSAWIGALCYALQIFFDFSGYSDMAIGLGKMFGFDFKENFNYPFSALGMTDFWRKWNISVSTWFKEYVYIPLGGNRKGKLRMGINKCIVFFLTGLWHGANLTFILWGMIHGFFLLMENYGIIPIKKAHNIVLKTAVHLYTVLIFVITFVIFRADTVTQAWEIIRNMFVGNLFVGADVAKNVYGMITPYFILTFLAGILFSTPIIPIINRKLTAKNSNTAVIVSCTVTMLLFVLCIFSLATAGYNPFIYFRF